MIHDIFPHKLNNSYKNKSITDSDCVMIFKQRCVLVCNNDDVYTIPQYMDVKSDIDGELKYLFEIDGETERCYYLLNGEYSGGTNKYVYLPLSEMRYMKGEGFKETYFIVCTAFHLYRWYDDNKFCGRCGRRTVHSDDQRMLMCASCGSQIFPRINPAVIVGVINGDKILVTRYAGRAYKGYALIAGFNEIGETPEQTVRREAMEEAGLKVKNIRYYKSQPGGIDGNLLLGFFCELDGDDKITIDSSELAEAEWYSREEIPVEDDGYSLTREMITAFKKGLIGL